MNEQRVALVTGANKGIGLQIAKDLAAKGITVVMGSRDLEAGEAAAKEIPKARAVQLDVTNADSVTAAAAWIKRELGRLDILVNNAGIAKVQKPSEMPLKDIKAVYDTNVFGVIAVTQAMLPLLREAPSGRIVNVSSGLGSLHNVSDPKNPYYGLSGPAYGSSKTALNALTIAFAAELKDTKIKVNAICPGYVATDLNNHQGPRTVQQGAREPVRMALIGDDGPTGGFTNEDGPMPW